LAATDQDYTVYIHLRDESGEVLATWDGPVSHSGDGNFYGTSLWEPGEFVRDVRLLRIDDATLPPVGEGYSLWIGLYDAATGERLPVTVGGEASGDGFQLNERLKVIAQEPG
jgi:hypothetical protein